MGTLARQCPVPCQRRCHFIYSFEKCSNFKPSTPLPWPQSNGLFFLGRSRAEDQLTSTCQGQPYGQRHGRESLHQVQIPYQGCYSGKWQFYWINSCLTCIVYLSPVFDFLVKSLNEHFMFFWKKKFHDNFIHAPYIMQRTFMSLCLFLFSLGICSLM